MRSPHQLESDSPQQTKLDRLRETQSVSNYLTEHTSLTPDGRKSMEGKKIENKKKSFFRKKSGVPCRRDLIL